MKTLKEFETGDGSHCGLADWYPDKRKALQVALTARKPFTTGWYCSKKEIASACITFDNLVEVTQQLRIEVSVSDDFDTPGKGVVVAKWTKDLAKVEKHVYAAWGKAGCEQKANRVYTGFKVLTRKRVHSTYASGKPVGKARLATVWCETYIRMDSDWCDLDKPPGDYYHKWGWQGGCKIPKAVREKLEDYACSYRNGKAASLTVGKWTIQPWEEAE